ncbi:MAG: GIY-YIG nuclease family protein [Maioricimonas sp. JB049]
MKFWNDSLRICRRCKSTIEMKEEVRTKCPKCRAEVWFFNYRILPPAPPLPPSRPPSLWKNPTTTLLLGAIGLFGLVALVAIHQTAIVAAVCSLGAIGFAVFGFIRHAEARGIEDALDHTHEIAQYAETMRNRIRELTARYNNLLQTGDVRIEQYFNEVYALAEQERKRSEDLRAAAMIDREAVQSVEERIYSMAERLIEDHLKWTTKKLRPDPENYQRRRNELTKCFDFVVNVGYELPSGLRQDALARLKEDYRRTVREQALKDEQKRIKQQMREEEKLRREREEAMREAEEKERALQELLDAAMRDHKDAHNAEVEELRRQLEDAQASSERAKSMAQQTKAGHVYILSNIGSFGEDIYKVGMTRRLEPQDRVKELGDASVPFPFDVHAMISCNDAPALENALHRELTRYRVNRVNLRKEYFQVELATILECVRQHHGEVEYVAEAEALQYRETQAISPEDLVRFESELVEVGALFEDDED